MRSLPTDINKCSVVEIKICIFDLCKAFDSKHNTVFLNGH